MYSCGFFLSRNRTCTVLVTYFEVWTLDRAVFAAALDESLGCRPTTADHGAGTAKPTSESSSHFFSSSRDRVTRGVEYAREHSFSSSIRGGGGSGGGRAGGARDAMAARLRRALATPSHRRGREDCEVVADALCHAPFLASLPRRVQLQIARALRYETAGEGQTLFRRGEVGDRAFFCISGRVRLGPEGGGGDLDFGFGARSTASREGRGRVGVGVEGGRGWNRTSTSSSHASSFYAAAAANFPRGARAGERAGTAELASRGVHGGVHEGVHGGVHYGQTVRAGGRRGAGGVIVGPGEQFGETALTREGGGVRLCDAVALEPCELATLDRVGTFFAFSAGAGHGVDLPGGSHSALSRAYAAAAEETPGVFACRGTVAASPGW